MTDVLSVKQQALENSDQIRKAFHRYIENQADANEAREFLDHIHSGLHKELFVELIEDQFDKEVDTAILHSPKTNARIDNTLVRIKSEISIAKNQHETKIWPKIFAIAAAITIIVLGVYFFNYNKGAKDRDANSLVQDIAPGKVGATLTLANGKKIRLSDAQKGEIAKEAGISVTKTVDGQLVYEIKESNNITDKINTLSTAKGETYILTLPDKSKVWLNAASSLTYSARLNERGVRRVKLEGEAYFEISKDKAHPFIVEATGQSLEVLGTHFNVNAYNDENGIKTTLLEGSVRVAGNVEKVTLKPGQQSLVSGKRGIEIKEVDVNDAIAWKNGKFRFDDTSLEDVMKQFARWYNVDVVYLDGIPNRRFTGGINRNITAAEALSLLQFSNVKFKIEGKKIIVTK